MCTFCEQSGWRRKVCNFCGSSRPHEVYISISIATGNEDEDFPYTQTEMCKGCWDKHGVDAAIEHNWMCAERA